MRHGGEGCDSCKFWTESERLGSTSIGVCRRFPPVPGARRLERVWPQTYKDDWCGEHERRVGL